ncbi:MAG TPA: S41 family peptidase [Luteibaculaceae bacterium]|nr:S41 family peptidase [Luteibaculaceae bacterium]
MKKWFVTGCVALLSASSFGQSSPALPNELEKFNTLLFQIDRFYTDSVNARKLVDAAIVKVLEDLDPHSVYIPKEEIAAMNEPLQGNFDGIGVEFNIMRDTVFVVNPIPSGPSEKLGIKAGDKIVKVDGVNIAGIGIKNSDVPKKLRGPKGSQVKISIMRDGVSQLLDFNITRDKIPIFSLEASFMATPKTGYIKISRFAATTHDEFVKAVQELKKQGMENLILDLQGNGGGYLKAATDMADEFLSDNKLIVFTQGRSFPKEETKAQNKGNFEKGKLVILIDEGSASASEIVSGAVQDWDRGVLVGRRSFGKGLVQRPFPLPDGSQVRLTVQRYYTPSGRCIQKPYDEGSEAYHKEKYERYSNGELFSIDSIQMPDSLRFLTSLKRPVYGGGGILPDFFVPIDTGEGSAYFSAMIRSGALNQFSLDYLNKNRERLSGTYKDMVDFKKRFEVTAELENEMTNFCANEGIEFNEADFAKSRRWIHLRFKATLARNLYENSAFYYIINDLNESFEKGLEVIEGAEYARMKLAKNAY